MGPGLLAPHVLRAFSLLERSEGGGEGKKRKGEREQRGRGAGGRHVKAAAAPAGNASARGLIEQSGTDAILKLVLLSCWIVCLMVAVFDHAELLGEHF